jgi:hypothetical protein
MDEVGILERLDANQYRLTVPDGPRLGLGGRAASAQKGSDMESDGAAQIDGAGYCQNPDNLSWRLLDCVQSVRS